MYINWQQIGKISRQYTYPE